MNNGTGDVFDDSSREKRDTFSRELLERVLKYNKGQSYKIIRTNT
jgi:hypothetical protein